MASEKKIRMSFTPSDLGHMYAGVGSLIGMLADGAAINDKRPSEIAAEVAELRGLQDRIFTAVQDNKVAEAQAEEVRRQEERRGLRVETNQPKAEEKPSPEASTERNL